MRKRGLGKRDPVPMDFCALRAKVVHKTPLAKITYSKIDPVTKQRSPMKTIITKEILETKSEPKSTFTNQHVPGFLGKRNRTDRGHLLANRLGGSGKLAENLVAIYARHNRGKMRVFEELVYNQAKDGKVVKYRVTPSYKAPDNLEIPDTIIL